MSCTAKQAAAIMKKLATLEKQLGNKPAGTQQPNKGSGKGTRRGGGRRAIRTRPMDGTASTASSTTLGTDLFASSAR
eukprot:4631486-Amphidinium_carterae.1